MPEEKQHFDTSVIISTYNNPVALEKTIWGYQAQSVADFELLIADDGSTEETARVIESFSGCGIPIRHFWQKDSGFRKNRILNKAIAGSQARYLVFTDGDCIPRSDFVETHRRLRKPKRFLVAGSHIALPETFHHSITRDDIISGDVFRSHWLKQQGHDSKKNLFRLSAQPWIQPLLNMSTHRTGIFTGNGSSVWRKDAVAVNGFDERLGYGGDDKDFGFRLTALGLRSRMSKFSLISLHLDHAQPWVDQEVVRSNHEHIRFIRRNKIHWTDHGIQHTVSAAPGTAMSPDFGIELGSELTDEFPLNRAA